MKMDFDKISDRLNLDQEQPLDVKDKDIEELETVVTNIQKINENPVTVKTSKEEDYPLTLQQNSSEAIDHIFQKETEQYEKIYADRNKKFNDILDSGKKILDLACYILNSTTNGSDPSSDAEVLTSASNLINSVKDIIKESNQSVLQQQEFLEKAKLEHLRAKLKKEIALTTKKPLNIGDGNTFNINNGDTIVPYDQSAVVREILKAQQEKEIK